MKTTTYFAHLPVILLAGLLAVLNSGCEKKEKPEPGAKGLPGQAAPAVVSAEKTSFDAVTSKLDPGGNLYLYLGTEQWLDGLSAKASNLRQIFSSMPTLGASERTNIDKGFDIVTRLIRRSGIEDVSGVGMSAVAREKGLYYSKLVVHHYKGKGTGALWNLFGKQSHPLTGLDFLSTNTALVCFSDLDLPLVWSELQQQADQSGFPQAKEWLQKVPEGFEQMTQLKWDQALSSLGGEYGVALSLDSSKMVPVPVPTAQGLQIPEPGLLIIAKVKDDTIFNRIDKALKENQQFSSQVVTEDKAGFKMRTIPLPVPLPIQLRPTIASSAGYLFIASNDGLIREALAIKGGQMPGLKSTAEFKRLAQGVPQAGNQFTFVGQRFGQLLTQVQQQMLTMMPGAQGQNSWLQSMVSQNGVMCSYDVSVNTEEGWISVGNGNQNPAAALLIPVAVVPGMLAGIALPNFVKARQTAQNNVCINNLRQIDGAKQQWALEKKKAATDTPTWDDLRPYLGRGQERTLTCPNGGVYTINSVGTAPRCSIPGHSLPD